MRSKNNFPDGNYLERADIFHSFEVAAKFMKGRSQSDTVLERDGASYWRKTHSTELQKQSVGLKFHMAKRYSEIFACHA